METKSKQEIRLKAVQTDNETDFYLEVKSNAKAAKETGMKEQFEKRFEEQLQKIHQAIHSKGGIKRADKVHEEKAKQINSKWSEIVRISNTQKVITTTGQNTSDKKVSIRKCSVPNQKLQSILDILKLKY